MQGAPEPDGLTEEEKAKYLVDIDRYDDADLRVELKEVFHFEWFRDGEQKSAYTWKKQQVLAVMRRRGLST